ncbi:hypothetical protein GPECTOR_1g809 [Gonium pectorale]|uniref:Rad50/SbcC-type AAA domain-containing protein n=1 Tax=Gonium pectorale TaxID=33097 RepID=A0A150H428_GONPE|nr:hypothetical protein GPECTOR_1g809 [Gonium pectorale]|eukprot:KXZ56897.1 hypothetical protein GPECTOR_1g809 [Gonium pectorale]
MCTVEKILIKGIRSFSPDNDYIIEFYKPLTIIVGSNGAGKTTIIECLRNATTGELPPNTRQGQGFVHDPKVAGESEVKAQIKLSFKTATGQPIYVTRSFQLTQKKTALQFKSLDAVLSCRNRNTGLRESVTYRCADLDRMVPTLMGVSKARGHQGAGAGAGGAGGFAGSAVARCLKRWGGVSWCWTAVLENVIFVHQEESNWPLAEGKVLKDKFDDIFAATKYTKALEALRKLRTEKAAALREYKLTLETLRQVRDMAAHHAGERDAAQGRVADCQAQLAGFDSKIKELEDQRSSVAARLGEVEGLARELGARRAQLEQLRATNREREERFKADGREDFEEGDEELRTHLADADRLAGEKGARVARLEAELNSARIAKEALADQYQRDCLRQGKLAGEAASHASNVSERDRTIRATAVALALPLPPEEAGGGGAGSFSSAAAEAFLGAVAGRVRELEGRLRELRSDARTHEARQSGAVDSANAAVARAQEGLRLKRLAIEENRQAISAAGAQIQMSQVTETSARALREDAERAEELYHRKQARGGDPGGGGAAARAAWGWEGPYPQPGGAAGGARAEEAGSELPRAVAEARTRVEAAGRRIAELRGERQRAAAEAEGAARLRLKRTDLASQEEQVGGLD